MTSDLLVTLTARRRPIRSARINQVAPPSPVGYDSSMSVSEVLQLPLRERLQIMEAMWEDLRKRADSFDIHQDHKDLLDGRRARIGTGQARILDWDSVKHSIGRA